MWMADYDVKTLEELLYLATAQQSYIDGDSDGRDIPSDADDIIEEAARIIEGL
jgi:hypothetical protein